MGEFLVAVSAYFVGGYAVFIKQIIAQDSRARSALAVDLARLFNVGKILYAERISFPDHQALNSAYSLNGNGRARGNVFLRAYTSADIS